MKKTLTKDTINSHDDYNIWRLEIKAEIDSEKGIIEDFNINQAHPLIYELVGKAVEKLKYANLMHDFSERTEWNKSSDSDRILIDIFFSRVNKPE
ncbi:MAG: hypothetical protein ABJF04_08540 [Reichenbachiella sp.]|uniref:hypothetical protein n=1 Tax=Reichenbachiella sp. TaxID=2184521 RepID=UPI0032676F32